MLIVGSLENERRELGFVHRILFVESHFTREGIFNSHNYHIIIYYKHYTLIRGYQHRFQINL